ncbi:DDHD domain-domain-containing protein [Syncephalastrum racemosum]|uniref:DDHD domain-domain-containing protein n=1 Tax=Syncephalastrum racemosum TaxID=13706 RepID=A0A1X2HDC7_SYNRA|nr:DDHD domain-domain-containing protein [Syncephalastrum racemosum]
MLEPDPPIQALAPGSPRTVGLSPDPTVPHLNAQWFYAADRPLDPNPPTPPSGQLHRSPSSSNLQKAKAPTIWLPFSQTDSDALERALDSDDIQITVPVNEDHLFEVKVFYRTLKPIYWDGPTFAVRRATWFMQGDSSKWVPCEEGLSQQIESGYRKHKPYNHEVGPSTSVQNKRSSFPVAKADDLETSMATVEEKKLEQTLAKQPVERQWNLLGPYLGQYVAYTGKNTAWLLSNSTSSKLAKTIITRLTNKQNLGGTRLIRGYAEVQKQLTRSPSSTPVPPHGDASSSESEEEELVQDTMESTDFVRKIDHLVLVVPGAGQRFSRQDIVRDVNDLRKSVKSVYPTACALNGIVDCPNGIQFLPVPWRQEIRFGVSTEEDEVEADLGMPNGDDGCPTLEELTVDSVPNIRTMVSDVIMDIPLYLTPKYREQMSNAICKQLNATFLEFVSRNPDFLERGGKVSIIGHSLGCSVAFDALTMQPMTSAPPTQQELLAALPDRLFHYRSATSLLFPVENFFALGSPVGVMLLLKGYRVAARKSRQLTVSRSPSVGSFHRTSRSSAQIPCCYPAASNVYNVFHKSDPVAYRLEPLISRQFGTSTKPANIPNIKELLKHGVDLKKNASSGGGITNRAGAMYESFKIGIATNMVMRGLGLSRQQIYNDMHADSSSDEEEEEDLEHESDLATSWPASARQTHARSSSDSAVHMSFANNTQRPGSPRRSPPTKLAVQSHYSDGARRLRMLNGSGRVDFCLQDKNSDNPYMNAFSAHLGYWQDLDLAAFLVKEIYTVHAD